MKKENLVPGKGRPLTVEEKRERVRIIVDLVRMKDRLARVGLYATMQVLDAAVNRVGYEDAEDILRWTKGKAALKRLAEEGRRGAHWVEANKAFIANGPFYDAEAD